MKARPPRGIVSVEFRAGWNAGYQQALLDALRERSPQQHFRRGFKPCPHPAEDGEPFHAMREGHIIR